MDVYVSPYAGAVGKNFILMDDNAHPHRARVVKRYLKCETIQRLDWPARSPDANQIECAWNMMLTAHSHGNPQPHTTQELTYTQGGVEQSSSMFSAQTNPEYAKSLSGRWWTYQILNMIPLNGQVVDIPDTKHDPFELLKHWMNIRSFDPRLPSILRVGV